LKDLSYVVEARQHPIAAIVIPVEGTCLPEVSEVLDPFPHRPLDTGLEMDYRATTQVHRSAVCVHSVSLVERRAPKAIIGRISAYLMAVKFRPPTTASRSGSNGPCEESLSATHLAWAGVSAGGGLEQFELDVEAV
jgi:hypothetical protein